MGKKYSNISSVFHTDKKKFCNIGSVWHSKKKELKNVGSIWYTGFKSAVEYTSTYTVTHCTVTSTTEFKATKSESADSIGVDFILTLNEPISITALSIHASRQAQDIDSTFDGRIYLRNASGTTITHIEATADTSQSCSASGTYSGSETIKTIAVTGNGDSKTTMLSITAKITTASGEQQLYQSGEIEE